MVVFVCWFIAQFGSNLHWELSCLGQNRINTIKNGVILVEKCNGNFGVAAEVFLLKWQTQTKKPLSHFHKPSVVPNRKFSLSLFLNKRWAVYVRKQKHTTGVHSYSSFLHKFYYQERYNFASYACAETYLTKCFREFIVWLLVVRGGSWLMQIRLSH